MPLLVVDGYRSDNEEDNDEDDGMSLGNLTAEMNSESDVETLASPKKRKIDQIYH